MNAAKSKMNIHFTTKAIEKVKDFANDQGMKPIVRLKVNGGGCSGLKGDMFFDDITTDTDEILEQDGIQIIIDQFSVHYLDNCVIDFIQDEYVSGFKFNFNDKASCGCGSSFSP